MSKHIPLSKGKAYAIVDDEDFEYLSQFTWSFLKGGYAFRRTWNGRLKKATCIYMHREIMQTPPNMHTDHVNGNGLDNRRSNLRICTVAENLANRTKLESRNTSGFKGVHLQKGRWIAQIGYQRGVVRKNTVLGSFDNPEEAAKEYDKAALKRYGEFAKLNFPVGG